MAAARASNPDALTATVAAAAPTKNEIQTPAVTAVCCAVSRRAVARSTRKIRFQKRPRVRSQAQKQVTGDRLGKFRSVTGVESCVDPHPPDPRDRDGLHSHGTGNEKNQRFGWKVRGPAARDEQSDQRDLKCQNQREGRADSLPPFHMPQRRPDQQAEDKRCDRHGKPPSVRPHRLCQPRRHRGPRSGSLAGFRPPLRRRASRAGRGDFRSFQSVRFHTWWRPVKRRGSVRRGMKIRAHLLRRPPDSGPSPAGLPAIPAAGPACRSGSKSRRGTFAGRRLPA